MDTPMRGGFRERERMLAAYVALAAAAGCLACAGASSPQRVVGSPSTAANPTRTQAIGEAEGVDPASVKTLLGRIHESEYWARENDQGLQAPNRHHDLRTYFEPTGIRVVDRSAPESIELISLSLAGWGRPPALTIPTAGEVTSHQDRVEITRPGLVEWYENTSDGLEQGFTLETPPPGAGPVVMELAISGGEASLEGNDVIFDTASGRRLRYGAFLANDATGRILEARLEVPAKHRLRLRVDDSEALYPIVLDPRITDEAVSASRLAVGQAGAYLGASVAGAGNPNGDGFDDVIAGSYGFDLSFSYPNAGVAAVYEGSSNGIADNQAPDWTFAVMQAYAQVGVSVDGAGDVNCDGVDDVIVGARYYDNGESNEGAAFVFHGSIPSGIQANHPTNPAGADAFIESNQIDAYLGQFVAGVGNIDGDPNDCDDIMVGAHGYERNASVNSEGAAFVFLGSPTGIQGSDPISANARIVADQNGAELGISDSGAGNVNADAFDDIIVGARNYDTDPNAPNNGGAAFVFHGSGSGIVGTGPNVWLTPANAQVRIVSSQVSGSFGVRTRGAGDVNNDGFDDVIVGAYYYDDPLDPNSNEGAAFVFHGSANGLLGGSSDGTEADADSKLYGNMPGARMGIGLAGAGDVNNDGFDDVIVGADDYDSLKDSEGAAFLFLGGPNGLVGSNPETAYALLHPASANVDSEFGYSVDGAGYVDDDDYADLVVGDHGDDTGGTNAGAVLFFSGKNVIDAASTSVTFSQTDGFDNSGWVFESYEESGLQPAGGFPVRICSSSDPPPNSCELCFLDPNDPNDVCIDSGGLRVLSNSRLRKEGKVTVRPDWTFEPTGDDLTITMRFQHDNGIKDPSQSSDASEGHDLWMVLRQNGVDHARFTGFSGSGDNQSFAATQTINGNTTFETLGYFSPAPPNLDLDLSATGAPISLGFFACCTTNDADIYDRRYTGIEFTVSGVEIDTDADGVLDPDDAFPTNPGESIDTDGDKIGNNADPDDDNDGFSDVKEAQAGTNPNDANDFPVSVPALGPFALTCLVGLLAAGAFSQLGRRHPS